MNGGKTIARRSADFVHWRMRRLIATGRYLLGHADEVLEGLEGSLRHREVEQTERDARIRYPCHKSLDEFIDVDRLRALEEGLRSTCLRILERSGGGRFDTGTSKLKLFSRRRGRSRTIPLTESNRPFSYFDLSVPEFWTPTEYLEEFPELWAFIQTLPFAEMSRVTIFADMDGHPVTPHRDHFNTEINHEFIWLRPNLTDKPFFLYDRQTGRKDYVKGHSAWFDTVNQFHGSDRTGKLQISLRVDGRFTEELRARYPVPETNAASTSALWAALS